MNPAFEATASFNAMPAEEPGSRREAASTISRLVFAVPPAFLLLLGSCMVLVSGKVATAEAVTAAVLVAVAAAVFAWREMTRAHRPGPAWIDRSTGLHNRAGLLAAGNQRVCASAPGAPVTLIVLEFADLRDVHDIYGSDLTRKVVAKLVRKIESIAGARGVAGRTGTAQFTVILPGTARDKALRRLERALGKPARVEFDAGDSEIVLVPDLMVDTADPGADSVQALYRDMCRELARIQQDELRRQHYLTRERERHSRPMGVSSR